MAGTTVTGDLYQKIDGKLGEIKRQLRQRGGYPFDLVKLDRGLQALIEGRFPDGLSIFSRDMTKNGWTLVEGSDEPDPAEFSVTEFEFVPILKRGETPISDVEMRTRASQENANFGQRTAEWLLAHPKKMPVRPKDIYLIPFPRTVWSSGIGNLLVPYLDWDGRRWILYFRSFDSSRTGIPLLGDGWDSRGGFLCPRK